MGTSSENGVLFMGGGFLERLQEAKFYYFIGSMLRHRQPKQAQLYFWRAVAAWFLFPRAWYGNFANCGRK